MGERSVQHLPDGSTIVTGYKPLLPLFNKATAKLPPRIEKWVMDMQDVDYEMRYEPGKDEADPMDFLSRHPLPETGEDETEETIKSVTEAEPAIVKQQQLKTALSKTLVGSYTKETGRNTEKTLTFHLLFRSKTNCTKPKVLYTE